MCTLIDADVDLLDETRPLFENVNLSISQYMRLVCKLIYLTVTRLDIAYVIESVSQFMHKLREIY